MRSGLRPCSRSVVVYWAPSSALAAKSVYYAGSTSPANTPMTLTLGKAKLTRLAVLYDTGCFSYGSVLNAAALRDVKSRSTSVREDHGQGRDEPDRQHAHLLDRAALP